MTGPGVPEHPDLPPRPTDAETPEAGTPEAETPEEGPVSTEEVAADPEAQAVGPAADPPVEAGLATAPPGDALPVAEPPPVVAGQALPGDALPVAEPPPVVAASEVTPASSAAAVEPVALAPVLVPPAVVALEVPAPVPPVAVEPVALTPVPLLPAGPEASGAPETPGSSPAVDLHKKSAPAAAAADAGAGAPSGSEPTATVEDPAQQPPPAATRGRARLALGLVAVLTALMVAGVTYLGLRLQDESQTEMAREQAVATSRDAARLLFSYDHAKLEEDFAKGLSVTTGAFREEYARTTSQVVAGVAKQYKAVVVADVVESAVVGASPDEVTTLVFLNQATTSTQTQGRQVDQSRVRMRLVNKDGRWLVAEVQAL